MMCINQHETKFNCWIGDTSFLHSRCSFLQNKITEALLYALKILQIQAPFNCKSMQSDEDGQILATHDCPHWDQITFLMERGAAKYDEITFPPKRGHEDVCNLIECCFLTFSSAKRLLVFSSSSLSSRTLRIFRRPLLLETEQLGTPE